VQKFAMRFLVIGVRLVNGVIERSIEGRQVLGVDGTLDGPPILTHKFVEIYRVFGLGQ
jgi:hypothetical protein